MLRKNVISVQNSTAKISTRFSKPYNELKEVNIVPAMYRYQNYPK